MPTIEYFPYNGPNRRLDIPVVEILLKFGPADISGLPRQVSDIRDPLVMPMGHVEKLQLPAYIKEYASKTLQSD